MLDVAKHIEAGGTELQDRAEFFRVASALVLVVADGAGGMSGGAEAAEFFMQFAKRALSAGGLYPEALSRVLMDADFEMAAVGACGETTAVVVAVTDGGVAGASVGDSGAWIVSPSNVDDLTAHQARKPFIGSGRANPVPFNRPSLNGTLVVASDGLFKYCSIDRIVATTLASDPAEAAKNLAGLVRYASGGLPDDLAILVARQIT